MNREDFAGALAGAFAVTDVAVIHALVPEEELARLARAARTTVFEAALVEDNGYVVPAAVIHELDRAGEAVSDRLPIGVRPVRSAEELTRCEECATRVKDWLDGGCVTLPPIDALRVIVDHCVPTR